jgi:dTDP-4-amino-4,6-dideoxy-D-galactose acyltransferase
MKISTTTKTTAKNPPRLLDWDTEFWGLRVGGAEGVEGLGQWAIENTIGLMCVLIDADAPDEAQRAEEQGFRFMDVRVTLHRETIRCGGMAREAKPADLPALKAIAGVSHRITRFYADPTLDDELCDDLYEEWIRRSLAGWADAVLVIDVDEEPVGYVTVHLNEETSSIGLIAVQEEMRGKGIGTMLVSSAVAWAHAHDAKQMTVVTQGRNIAAQRLFQHGGFRTSGTALWFHRRYGEAG